MCLLIVSIKFILCCTQIMRYIRKPCSSLLRLCSVVGIVLHVLYVCMPTLIATITMKALKCITLGAVYIHCHVFCTYMHSNLHTLTNIQVRKCTEVCQRQTSENSLLPALRGISGKQTVICIIYDIATSCHCNMQNSKF